MNMNATLIGQSIAFIIFVWFCMKYVWPPLLGAIEERQKAIADGLASAERAGNDLKLAQQAATEKLTEAKLQAAEIIEQANKRSSLMIEEAKNEAVLVRDKIIAQGEVEIEAERNRAKEQLRSQVAVLAVAGAEKIIERTIDAEAHADIIDKLAAEL
ncbi:F0F1 ATP synthase subunit B [Ferrimonas lipolytica]|uniref:ATP synthase subunit b n=1 Tax=Ferrimonas lipolytica TaxID=2724191 RepID=A0A6H1UHX2_9GAMM|nr:F0F1 ATP synthase subunit B [Ferrimonas lipolytica]QIZ78229.1 F0F1 ATP synthase subunit B [Ferrimonas lipolytica]